MFSKGEDCSLVSEFSSLVKGFEVFCGVIVVIRNFVQVFVVISKSI